MQPSSSQQEPMPKTYSGHKGPVYTLAPAGKDAFLSGSGDGMVVRWKLSDAENGEVLVNVGQAIFSLLQHTSSGLLFIGTEGGALHVVDPRSKKELRQFLVHRKGIFRIKELPDGKILCAGGDGTLSIWQLPTEHASEMHLFRQIPITEGKVRDLALHDDGKALAVACGDGTIRIFDTVTFNELHTIEGHMGQSDQPATQGASSVFYHPTKPVLLSGGKDGFFKGWHIHQDYRPLYEIPAHKGSIYSIGCNSGATVCATVSRDRTIKLWDARRMDVLKRFDRAADGHTHSVNALLWMDDLLLSASDDRTIKLWSQNDPTVLGTLDR